MKIRKPKIEFPTSANSDYWFLSWKGKYYPKEGVLNRNLYFVNTFDFSDKTSCMNFAETYSISIPFNNDLFFSVGEIYNKKGVMKKGVGDYTKKLKIKNGVLPFYKTTSKSVGIDVNYCKGYPFPKNDELHGLNYFHLNIFERDFTKSQKETKEIKCILPADILCHFLFFKSNNLLNILLMNRLADFVPIDRIKIYQEEDIIIGELAYDNTKLKKRDVEYLAPYFFFKNSRGIKSMYSIGSNLINDLIVKNNNDEEVKSSIKIDLPFDCKSKMTLQGKEFFDSGSDCNYFVVYNILKLELEDTKQLIVDRIRVVPMHPNDSTKDRKNHKPIVIERNQADRGNDNLDINIDNIPGNSAFPVGEERIDKVILSELFNIPIEHSKREKQLNAYQVKTNIFKKEIDSITTCLDDFDSNSKAMRTNFSEITLTINRYDYIVRAIEKLKENIIVEAKYLSLNRELSKMKTIYLFYAGRAYEVMIVQLLYEGRYYYIVEFDKGYTGLISNKNYLNITVDKLILLLREFMVRKIKWSEFHESSDDFLKQHDIIVFEPIEHQKNKFKSIDDLIKHASGKIEQKIKYKAA